MVDDAPWPPFWKSPAYASHLQSAAGGRSFRASPRLARSVAAAAEAAKAARRLKPAGRVETVGLQAAAVLAFSANFFKPNFAATIVDRWAGMVGLPKAMIVLSEQDVLLARLGGIPQPHVAIHSDVAQTSGLGVKPFQNGASDVVGSDRRGSVVVNKR